MFGFLRPPPHERPYRQIYAACCAYQRRSYGLESLAFHSYEAVFLYLLAVDAGVVSAPSADAVTCCRLGWHAADEGVDPRLAQFCAAFAMLLAEIKVRDDQNDEPSLLMRIVSRRLNGRFQRARDYLRSLDSHFDLRIHEFLAAHAQLEQSAEVKPTLDEYVEPTAAAFGYIFQLSTVCVPELASLDSVLVEIGRRIGAAIIAFDSAVDFDHDQRRGLYNPLSRRADIAAALRFASVQLVEVGWCWSDGVRADGIASRLVRWRIEAISRRLRQFRHLELQRVPRRKLAVLRRGDCDCDGCSCCCEALFSDACSGLPCHEGLCCHSGPASLDCLSGSDSPFCCREACDPICCCDSQDCSRTRRREQPTVQQVDRTSLVGKPGVSRTTLSPNGFVEVEGREYPARSTEGWINVGMHVEVTEVNGFGIVVRQRSEG
ncbi:MAG: hypothetical protein KDB23_08135 [Planctomycetales bacterium]|nr:hypothetical protein [Planctomycetales bacterium]